MESNPARETCHEHKTVHVQDYLKARFLNMVNKNEERLHLFYVLVVWDFQRSYEIKHCFQEIT